MDRVDLKNLGVIITRPKGQTKLLTPKVNGAGGSAFEVPALEICDSHTPKEEIEALLSGSDLFDYLLFTSPNSVTYGLKFGLTLPKKGEKGPELIAIGTGTENALKEVTDHPIIKAPKPYTSEALIEELKTVDLSGRSLLLISGEGGRRILGDSLRDDYGAHTQYIDVYRRKKPSSFPLDEVKKHGENHPLILLITSQEALSNIDSALKESGIKPKLAATIVGSDRLRAHAQSLGYSPIIVAASALEADMWQSIQEHASHFSSLHRMRSTVMEHLSKEHSQKIDPKESHPIAEEAAQEMLEEGAPLFEEDRQEKEREQSAIEADNTPLPSTDSIDDRVIIKKSGGFTSALALLLALGAAGLAGYNYYEANLAPKSSPNFSTKEEVEALKGAHNSLSNELSQLSHRFDGLPKEQIITPEEVAQLRAQIERLSDVDALAINLQELEQSLKDKSFTLEGATITLSEQQANFQKELNTLAEQIEAQGGDLSQINAIADEAERIASNFSLKMEEEFQRQRQVVQEAERLIKAVKESADFDALTFNEIEYLLNVANYKLTLEGNLPAAIETLTQVNDRLERINHLNFETTKERLQNRLEALRAIKPIDLQAESEKIRAISEAVSEATLLLDPTISELKDELQSKKSGKEGENWFTNVKENLTPLFVAGNRRLDDPQFLHADDRFMINQNIQLLLNSAKSSLLQGEEALMKEQLKEAKGWIEHYYAQDDSAATRAIIEIEALLKLNLTPDYPSLEPIINAFNATRALYSQP